jgi:cell division protein FtsQ
MARNASRGTSRNASPNNEAENRFRWGRIFVYASLCAVTMVGSLYAWRCTEEFLIKDDRFRVPEADYSAGPSPSLHVEGVHYASPSQIHHVFASDLGRSLYLLPLNDRRKQLMAIDWVEEASVSKIWPNKIIVHLKERRPVAFVRLTASRRNGPSQFALIDREGVILRPRVPEKFTLPVITGIRETDEQLDRRMRVRKALAMLKDLGALADPISEVDVADASNLMASEKIDGRVVMLKLGEENYQSRVAYFMSAYPEIKARRPDANVFDMRVDGSAAAAVADKFSNGSEVGVK